MKNITLITLFILFGVTTYAAEWEQRASFGGNGRHRGTAISIGTKGYMGLGHYNGNGINYIMNDWWEFDPATNSWTQKMDYPAGNNVGDYGVISFGMAEVGYVGSGQIFGTQFFKFDPTTNQWTQMASPSISHSNSQCFVIDNKAYCMNAGGDAMYSYNTDLDSWSVEAIRPFLLNYWNSCFTVDGIGYVKTGQSLWQYKATTQQWLQRAPFPGLATGGSVSFVQNGKAYILTGYAGALSQVQSEVWEYDPLTNLWTQFADFPGTSRRFAASFSIGDKCYIGTGTNGTNFNDFWEFDAFASLENNQELGIFLAFPNPATNKLIIQAEKLNGFKVDITDPTGKIVRTESTYNSEITIDRGDLVNGFYYYTVSKNGTPIYTDKFILE